MLKAHPTSYPSRVQEADAVTNTFIADIHSRVPGLCGTALKYSSKAFTPTVRLQPVTACYWSRNYHDQQRGQHEAWISPQTYSQN